MHTNDSRPCPHYGFSVRSTRKPLRMFRRVPTQLAHSRLGGSLVGALSPRSVRSPSVSGTRYHRAVTRSLRRSPRRGPTAVLGNRGEGNGLGPVGDPEFGPWQRRSASLGSSARSPSGSAQRAGEQGRGSFRWCDQLSRLRTRRHRQGRSSLTWTNLFRGPATTE